MGNEKELDLDINDESNKNLREILFYAASHEDI